MCHVDHTRLRRHPVIFHLVIFHSGHDRERYNARILAAFCYGQQSRNVGVARARRSRTGERDSSKFQRSGPDNSGADKQNKRRPDIRRRREHERERDPIALQFHPASIPRGNPSGETKASNATVGREFGREFVGAREHERASSSDIIRRDFCHPLPRNSNPRRRGKRSGTR
ncbi:hypothetical protein DBV15_03645 [Temnothorax longispinosus]|uniref:Uncharacterized protein n=1 Tax=Temnothorax longispinosus TaxID=300112 RepID=A0A4S2KF44_9HYME|nr:hypothetical protein DBV15_03645 [Temnothorax longispinosus]